MGHIYCVYILFHWLQPENEGNALDVLVDVISTCMAGYLYVSVNLCKCISSRDPLIGDFMTSKCKVCMLGLKNVMRVCEGFKLKASQVLLSLIIV